MEPAAPLAERLADLAWRRAAPGLAARPRPRQPLLVVLAGAPLSGKTTLARALAGAATTATLHVENDALRADVAEALGTGAPTHDPGENFLTYRTSWDLARRGLREGCNVLHDGTNLTESGRRGAYRAADDAGAPAVVLFVAAPEVERAARAAARGPDRQRAHAKLGPRAPRPAASRPFLAVDGTAPLDATLAWLRRAPELAPLFEI